MKMEEPPEIPDEFVDEDWDEVDLDEYFTDEEQERFQMYLDMGPEEEDSVTMSDGEMIDSYMDMQARHDELERTADECVGAKDFEKWKSVRESITSLERDMDQLAEQYRKQYPGSEIEDAANDMRDDQDDLENEDEQMF